MVVRCKGLQTEGAQEGGLGRFGSATTETVEMSLARSTAAGYLDD